MKPFIAAVVASAALSTAASAGNLATPIMPEPVIAAPAPVAATDWRGFYLGGELGNLDFTLNGAQSPSTVTSKIAGGFLGYNFQRGSMIFGVEVEATSGDDFTTSNLKGRVGYAFGRSMVYGFLGESAMNMGAMGDYSGLGYGVGAAYQFTNGIFVGLEAKGANLSSPDVPFSIDSTDAAVRIGWQF